MFRGLRLRLTLLYLMAAMALVALVGGSAYRLLSYYFETTTDLALQHRMAEEFRRLDAPLPPELAAGDRAWYASLEHGLPWPAVRPTGVRSRREEDEDHLPSPRLRHPSPLGRGDGGEGAGADEPYAGELAAIFVLPLGPRGDLLFNPNPYALPISPDPQAVSTALAQGSDWRTVTLPSGDRVRLLTYRLTRGDGPTLMQVGRMLGDQDRVLGQLLIGLLALGGASTVLLGAGSWWLAGRSLQPLQQAWEQQQTFVANASHELRTPLTLVRASAEVARRGLSADDERRGLLDDVLQECDHMGRLVEDLLLLSRLDAGRLSLDRKAISVSDLFADVQRQMGRLAEERGVRLVVGDASGTVWGDPTRLWQVLLILLDNALRYTPAGGSIRLEARPQGRMVQITVADTGSGIAPEHLPHVFDRFYRADSARGSDTGGSGLGLAIARGLVEAQQGRIRLESQVGEGSRVTLTLPRVAKYM